MTNALYWLGISEWGPAKFEWQEGYGAFPYSLSALGSVIAYVHNQKKHHRKKTFREEYIEYLKKLKLNSRKSTSLNGLIWIGTWIDVHLWLQCVFYMRPLRGRVNALRNSNAINMLPLQGNGFEKVFLITQCHGFHSNA